MIVPAELLDLARRLDVLRCHLRELLVEIDFLALRMEFVAESASFSELEDLSNVRS